MVKIIAKMDPRDGAKLVGKWLYVQASFANGDWQCELHCMQSDYRRPPLLGDAPEGMVRTVIDLPAPPVPYERIVWKDPENAEWYLATYEQQSVGIWRQWNAPPSHRGQPALVAVPPAPKVTFPASVPGFKKGTWFAMDEQCEWFWFQSAPMKSFDKWIVGQGGRCGQVLKQMNAYDTLQKLCGIRWEQCCFQTMEDS